MAYNAHVSGDNSAVADSTTVMAPEVKDRLDSLFEEDISNEDVDSLFGDPISDEPQGNIDSTAASGSPKTTTKRPFLALPPGGILRTGSPPQESRQLVEPEPLATPQKRGRGRPKGSKSPPKPVVHYRCRYGCERHFNAVGLRKHMSRVHCVFSSAHNDNLRKCLCGRTFDPTNSSLACTKRYNDPDMDLCKTPSAATEALFNVPGPRDAQEAADTFAYDGEGPNGERPSDLVVVREGDDEEERREANAEAIKNWKPQPTRAPTDYSNVSSGSSATETSPRSSPSSVIDLTGDEEVKVLPSPPVPTKMGRGKKRPAEWEQPESKRVALGPMIDQPAYAGFSAVNGAAPIMTGFNPAIPTIAAPQFSAAPVLARAHVINYGFNVPLPAGQNFCTGMQPQARVNYGAVAVGGFGDIRSAVDEAVMGMFDGTMDDFGDIDYNTLPTEFGSAEVAEAARNFRM